MLLALVLGTPATAQTSPEDSTAALALPALQYTDHNYKPSIKTARFVLEGQELYPPVITLDGDERLTLSFDELGEDVQTYTYTYVLCNQDWTPSDLSTFDYLGGFLEGSINDYSLSSGTRVQYVHYKLVLPNSDMTLTKSGNYLLKVYANNDPKQLVLTRRFYVLDNKVNIKAEVRIPNAPQYSSTHQEVQFNLMVRNLGLTNPFDEISVTVMQNFMPVGAYTGLKPQFVKEDSLIFRNDSKIVFPAMKEFRYFDTRSLLTLSPRVKDYNYLENLITLFPDEVRSFKQYDYYKESNGKYIIAKTDATDNDVQSDYTKVRFRLDAGTPFPDAGIYVFGGLTDWQTNDDNKLIYNYKDRTYEKEILLKQGFYNYLYAYKRKDGKEIEANLFEGNSYETENDYQILVYYRPPGARYDQLVGVKELNSYKK